MGSITPNFDHIEDDSIERSEQEEPRRVKRRRLLYTDNQAPSSSSSNNNIDQIKWRSVTEEQTYSSKLIEALRHVRRRSLPPSSSSITSRSRTVRETADKVLAVAAKGRTRWSRAILTNRIKMRLRYQHKKAKSPESKVAATVEGRCSRRPSNSISGGMVIVGGDKRRKLLPELEKRVQVLGQLVPGCRKLPFANLLEEATDYIAALEMQVRAMAALAELLTVRSGAPSAASTGAAFAPTSPQESSYSQLELSSHDENRH